MQPELFIILGIIIAFLILQGLTVTIIIRHLTVKNIKQEINSINNSLIDLETNIKELESNLIASCSEVCHSNENKKNNETVIASAGELSPSEIEALLAGVDSVRGTSQKAPEKYKPFDFIRKYDPAHLLDIIYCEHPQTIALILSYMSSNKSSLILQNLPDEVQSDVIRRIASMNRTNPKIVSAVERILEQRLESRVAYPYSGGVESAVEILSLIDRVSEKNIMTMLEEEDPELAEDIKKRVFVFDDIVILDDRSLQKVMREVDSQGLAKALKSTTAEVQDKFFKNMSKRAAEMLKEEMEYMGPVRRSDVEEAQDKIVMIIRHLEDTGEIAIARASDEIII